MSTDTQECLYLQINDKLMHLLVLKTICMIRRQCDGKEMQQKPLVLNWVCRLTQVVLYNGRKMIVVVIKRI